ncbi:hypothetical protein C8Q74DRAFT_1258063 [Fomes fomentarius]|nr:hypothetical protein C8Q74DRAFT_1258063 [Fomes fomentarius]
MLNRSLERVIPDLVQGAGRFDSPTSTLTRHSLFFSTSRFPIWSAWPLLLLLLPGFPLSQGSPEIDPLKVPGEPNLCYDSNLPPPLPTPDSSPWSEDQFHTNHDVHPLSIWEPNRVKHKPQTPSIASPSAPPIHTVQHLKIIMMLQTMKIRGQERRPRQLDLHSLFRFWDRISTAPLVIPVRRGATRRSPSYVLAAEVHQRNRARSACSRI